eukprot:TRINITY_DN1911_c0_g2_i2.p1 TRINITY_DN1911_c0_g2~~TRINITY_DN1911_c0_g2_i2.p1  ORF type:complete len:832 (+),score=289.18 TRINITY_DN1911_c0_g2_i2:182-2677(+)
MDQNYRRDRDNRDNRNHRNYNGNYGRYPSQSPEYRQHNRQHFSPYSRDGRRDFNRRDQYHHSPQQKSPENAKKPFKTFEPGHHRKREIVAKKFANLSEREEIIRRINSLIVRLGDKSSSSLSENVEALVSLSEAELENSMEEFLETIVKCVKGLPHKATAYASLCAVLSIRKSSFSSRLLLKMARELEDSLKNFKYLDSRSLLKFTVLLVNFGVVSSSSLLQLLDNMVEAANYNEEHSISRRDCLVYLVLSSFHWFERPRLDVRGEEWKGLWNKLNEYFTKRNDEKETPSIVESIKDSFKTDYIIQLWKEIEGRSGKEGEESLDKLEMEGFHLKFADQLKDLKEENFPLTLFDSKSIPLAPNSNKSIVFPYCRAPLNLFEEYLDEEEPKMEFYKRNHLEILIIDVLNNFVSDPKEAIKLILSFSNGVLYDRLIVETLFSQLFLLPQTPFVEVYYSVLIQEICNQHTSFPQILATAIDASFEKIEKLDVECIDRFAHWFAHHLSNFDYKWIWSSWDFVLDEKEESIRVFFIKQTLEKMIRLSYHDRVKKSLPEEFHIYLPSIVAAKFRYDEGEKSEDANHLYERVRLKEDSEELKTVLSGEQFSKYSEIERLQLLAQSIFKFGSKSFSHVMNSLERYLPLLTSLVSTKEDQIALLEEAASIWETSDLNLFILIERMMTFRLIDGTSVADWIFSKPAMFTKAVTWEIMRSVISKSIHIAESLRNDIKLVGEDEKRAEERTKLQNSLDSIIRDQREMFIIIFQRFSITLRDHITQSEEGKENTFWFHCTLGHYTEIARRYYDHLSLFLPMLETILLSEHVDERIRRVFLEMKKV